MTRRVPRLPFIVTVSVSASLVGACGSDVVTTGQQDPNCPAEPPQPFDFDCGDVPLDAVCTYDVPCQSGDRQLTFSCDPDANGWMLEPTECALPHDSCPGTEYHCVSTWSMPIGTNPPAPCPAQPPTAGSACNDMQMGGFRSQCGYLCDDGTTWTVATCEGADFDVDGAWAYDDACP